MGLPIDRRRFLGRLAGGGAGAAMLAELGLPLRAAPVAPVPVKRIRGRVVSRGRGLSRVAVSDGITVVPTDADGTYEIVTTARSRFLFLSVPAGYRIPVQANGTARFYQPIGNASEQQISFSLEPLQASDETHTFFLLADPQTRDRQEISLLEAHTIPDLKASAAQAAGEIFAITCGDIMYDHLELYPEYERAIGRLEIPVFQLVGNHDLDLEARTMPAATRTYRRHFGPEHYSFNRGRVHYVVLEDVFWYGGGYLGYLTEQQLAWLEADLALVERGSTVVVATHIPLLSRRFARLGEASPPIRDSVANRALLYRMLEDYRVHVLTGHTHESEHVFEGGVHEHVHGTACGAWWTGPICHDGTPNGYGIYQVLGEEIRWLYKSTGYPKTHQMHLYPRGADPTAPEEMVANVWDWEPGWKVFWYENGERRGAMARRTGLDPLSVELYRGGDRPPKHPWVEPQPTDHLFYAPVSQGREVRVEAIDRFGRVYSETL